MRCEGALSANKPGKRDASLARGQHHRADACVESREKKSRPGCKVI